MKVKLDENLGTRGADLLRTAGWDVATLLAEDLCATSDATLAEVGFTQSLACQSSHRA